MLNTFASLIICFGCLAGVWLAGLWVGWGLAEENEREMRRRQEMPSVN